jgi:ankyrin repeat protein
MRNSTKTPLFFAALDGHGQVVRILLDNGAQFQCKDKLYKQTPVQWAAKVGHAEILELLIEEKADFKGRDGISITLLSLAAGNGNEDVVQILLKKGADIEFRDNEFGQTTLLWAAKRGRNSCGGFTWRHADLSSRDKVGLTALKLAYENGHQNALRLKHGVYF